MKRKTAPNTYQRRIDQLVAQSRAMPEGSVKVELLEEAARLADSVNDRDQGFQIRRDLMHAATFAGRPELLLVAFSWCLAQSDHDPKTFAPTELLWPYKWVLNNLRRFPQVNLEQIESAYADAAHRFERAGASLRPIYKSRWCFEVSRGDFNAALSAYTVMSRLPDDQYGDCAACDQHSRVWYQRRLGNDDEAIRLAAPLLQGRMSCATKPQNTLAEVLIPLLRWGRVEEAMTCHRKGCRMIVGNPGGFLDAFGDHIEFLALTDNFQKTIRLTQQYLPLAAETHDQADRWNFFLGVS